MSATSDTRVDTANDMPFGHPSFANPWSLRVFGVTLAAAEAGVFTLQEFQQALIAQIQAWESSGRCIDSDEIYYTRWTDALTELLCRKNVLPIARLAGAERAVRDALKALQQDHDHPHGHDQDEPNEPPMPLHVEAAQ